MHNPGVIPEDVSLQIFQRSFSTKSKKGRGLGTYMMKFIGEGHLGGNVDFTTSETEGTRFSIFIPIEQSTDRMAFRERNGQHRASGDFISDTAAAAGDHKNLTLKAVINGMHASLLIRLNTL